MKTPEDPTSQHPRRLSDASYDFKLIFFYLVGMMVLSVAGRAIPVGAQLTVAVLLAGVLTALSIRNRRAAGWHWPSVGARGVRGAVVSAAATAIFLFAMTSLFPPNDPAALPSYLAVLGIGVGDILRDLRVAPTSRVEFEADCRGDAVPRSTVATTAIEPAWKRRVRAVFWALVCLVTLDWAAFFYVHGVSIRDGSNIQTATHSVPLIEHGRTVYITSEHDRMRGLLEKIYMVGFTLMVVGGFGLHYLIGVQFYQPRRSE